MGIKKEEPRKGRHYASLIIPKTHRFDPKYVFGYAAFLCRPLRGSIHFYCTPGFHAPGLHNDAPFGGWIKTPTDGSDVNEDYTFTETL